MDKPVETRHGPYTIKAGVLHGTATARAFVTGGKAGLVAQADADSIEDAIAALKHDLDGRAASERSTRRHDPVLDFLVPTAREYLQALQVIKPHDGHLKMLRAHAIAADKGLTPGELAFDAGYQTQSAANLQYGLLGGQIARALGLELPKAALRTEEDVSTGVLATAGRPRTDGQFVWVMHAELREAVADYVAMV